MAKREERWTLELLVETITDIDVFAVKNTATLRAVIEEGRVVFDANREGERKFARLGDVSCERADD